jgi:hypothetical protein
MKAIFCATLGRDWGLMKQRKFFLLRSGSGCSRRVSSWKIRSSGLARKLLRQTQEAGGAIMKMKWMLGALLLCAFAVPSFAGGPQISVFIGTPPPAVVYEPPPPPPDPGFVWVEGYWIPQGHHYRWVGGHWERPPYAGAYWSHPHYDHYREGWQYHEGHWDHEDHGNHYGEYKHGKGHGHDRDDDHDHGHGHDRDHGR